MTKVGSPHHWMARLAFLAAVAFGILAIVGGAGADVWAAAATWLTAAGVALLFGIYFILDGAVYASGKKK